MPDTDDPTNGELAVMIHGLESKLKEAADEETRFHVRLDSRLETLSSQIVTLQLAQATDRERLQAQIEANSARMDRHDNYTERQEKAGRDEKEQVRREQQAALEKTATRAQIVTAAVAVVALIAGVVVGFVH